MTSRGPGCATTGAPAPALSSEDDHAAAATRIDDHDATAVAEALEQVERDVNEHLQETTHDDPRS